MRHSPLKWIPLLFLGLAGCNQPLGPLGSGSSAGSLHVTSTPPGAAIAIDGVLLNVNTPYTFTSIAAGLHGLRLTLDGYDPATGIVQVKPGETAEATADMLPSFVEPLSPQALVSDVATAFNRREPGSYTAFLGPTFRFLTTSSDQSAHGLPAAYDRASEVQFAQNLLVSGAPGLPAPSRVAVVFTSLQLSDDPRAGHSGWKIAQLQSQFSAQFDSGAGIQFSGPIRLTMARDLDVDGKWRAMEWAEGSSTPAAGSVGAATPFSWGQLRAAYLAQAAGKGQRTAVLS